MIIHTCTVGHKLTELYIRRNQLSDFSELEHLTTLPNLTASFKTNYYHPVKGWTYMMYVCMYWTFLGGGGGISACKVSSAYKELWVTKIFFNLKGNVYIVAERQ